MIRWIKWLLGRGYPCLSFPATIEAQCHACWREARRIAKENGYPDTGKLRKLKVSVREKAEKQGPMGWAWQHRGQYVLGLAHTRGNRVYEIEVGMYPHDSVLIHEMLHCLLMANYDIKEHIEIMKDKAWGWHGDVG